VTRVTRENGGVYAITVRENEGTRVVYVNDSGTIVQTPSSTTTTTTTEPTEEQVVTYEEVQRDLPRYQLIKKEHDKEVYLDRQTGQKVKVKREKDQKRTDPNLMHGRHHYGGAFSVFLRKTVEPLQWSILVFWYVAQLSVGGCFSCSKQAQFSQIGKT
jgi:hypothetical protein